MPVSPDTACQPLVDSAARTFALRRSATCTWVLCGFLAVFGGCNGNASTAKSATSSTTNPEAALTPEDDAAQQCRDLLLSIQDIFALETLGFSSQIPDGVALVNRWQRMCGSPAGAGTTEEYDLPAEVTERLEQSLTATQSSLIRRRIFNDRDGQRIRDALLLKAMLPAAMQNATQDTERVTQIFEFVVEHLNLTTEHANGIPLPLYEICLSGQGTVADRAWCFAELLRQLKIDAVVLSAPAAADADEWNPNQPVLIGVLLGEQVLLFDPQLGVALTHDTAPLTLTAARANPDILPTASVNKAAASPFTAEWLTAAEALVVGDTSLWSERMATLQGAFTGAQSLTLSDRLVDHGTEAGVLSRVAKFPGQPWKAEQIKVWSYPETQWAGYQDLSAQHEQTLNRMHELWPFPFDTKQVGQEGAQRQVTEPTYQFVKARLAQLRGDNAQAISSYTTIQILCPKPKDKIPPQLRNDAAYVRGFNAYARAGEEVAYWVGVAKRDEGTADAQRVAIQKFSSYLKNYPEGDFVAEAHLQAAELAAEKQDTTAAVEHLTHIPEDHPLAARARYLRQLWQPAAEAPAPPAETPAPTPAAPAAETPAPTDK